MQKLLHTADPQALIERLKGSHHTGEDDDDETADPNYVPEEKDEEEEEDYQPTDGQEVCVGPLAGSQAVCVDHYISGEQQQQRQQDYVDTSALLPQALTVDFKKELQALTADTDPTDLVDTVTRLIRYILTINTALDTKGWTSPLNSVTKSLEDKHRAALAGFYDYGDDEEDEECGQNVFGGDNPIVGDGLYTDKMGCVSCAGIAKAVCRDCFSIRKCHRCFVEEGCGFRASEHTRECRNVGNRGHLAYRGKKLATTVKFAYLQAYTGPYGWVYYFATRPLAVITAHHLKLHLKDGLSKYAGSADNAQYSRSTLYRKPPLLTNYWSTEKLICRAQGCKNFANFVQNMVIAPPKKAPTSTAAATTPQDKNVPPPSSPPHDFRRRGARS